MLDRALKLIVVLTLGAFLAEVVLGLVTRLLEKLLVTGSSAVHSVGWLGQLLLAVGSAILVVGLVVRLLRWAGSTHSRTRNHRQGQSEWSGRSFADDVPIDRRHARSRSLRRRK